MSRNAEMFKNMRLISTFACTLFAATAANAIPLTDTVEQNVYVGMWDSYSYTHDLTDDGFTPGSALRGNLEIQFSDDGGQADGWEIVLVAVEDFDFDTDGLIFPVDAFSTDLGVSALAQVNATGILDVSVYSLWGDFYVGKSVLTIDTGTGEQAIERASVPEPTILALLGFGALGFGFARRTRRS